MRTKEIDGVWKNKTSGKLLKIRSSRFVRMIDGDTDIPYALGYLVRDMGKHYFGEAIKLRGIVEYKQTEGA